MGTRTVWAAIVAATAVIALGTGAALAADGPPAGAGGPPAGAGAPPTGAGGPPGGAGGGPGAAQLAQLTCLQMQGQLGAQFASKFGSMAGCIGKVTPLATAAAQKCATSADQQGCITTALTATVTSLLGGGSSGGTSAASLGNTIATQTCTTAQKQLKAQFPFASLAACKAKIKAQATTIAAAALKKCGISAAAQACLQKEIQAKAASLQAAFPKAKTK
jgi:hypothetical protein